MNGVQKRGLQARAINVLHCICVSGYYHHHHQPPPPPPPPNKTKQQQQKNWRYSGPTLERLCVGQSKERDWRGRTMQGRGR